MCLPSHDGFFPVELNCVRAYKRYCARVEEKFGVGFLIVGSHVGDKSVGGWTGVKNGGEGLKDSTDPSSSSLALHLFPVLALLLHSAVLLLSKLNFH